MNSSIESCEDIRVKQQRIPEIFPIGKGATSGFDAYPGRYGTWAIFWNSSSMGISPGTHQGIDQKWLDTHNFPWFQCLIIDVKAGTFFFRCEELTDVSLQVAPHLQDQAGTGLQWTPQVSPILLQNERLEAENARHTERRRFRTWQIMIFRFQPWALGFWKFLALTRKSCQRNFLKLSDNWSTGIWSATPCLAFCLLTNLMIQRFQCRGRK